MPVASLRRKADILGFDQAVSVCVNDMAASCGLEGTGLKAYETVPLIGAGIASAVPTGTRAIRTCRSMASQRS